MPTLPDMSAPYKKYGKISEASRPGEPSEETAAVQRGRGNAWLHHLPGEYRDVEVILDVETNDIILEIKARGKRSMKPMHPPDSPSPPKALYNATQCGRGGIGRRNGLKLKFECAHGKPGT